MALTLDVQCASDAPGIPPASRLEDWVRAAINDAADRPRERAELSLRIVDEEEGAELNQRYRGRPGPTNVLSFPFEAPEIPAPGESELLDDYAALAAELDGLLGDIVICAPVVAREAAEQHKALDAHWAHLVVHGVLHLLGHDHIDPAEAAHMEALETAILGGLGFPPPYEGPEISHDERSI
jgi:probable rRNA maturation factor